MEGSLVQSLSLIHILDTWTSDAKEAHVIKKLVVGETYTLREEFAPYGYLKACLLYTSRCV